MEEIKKTLNILYQTDRHTIEDLDLVPKHLDQILWYPEDKRTPQQRVDWVLEFRKKQLPNHLVLVSACPYVIEAFVKCFRGQAQIKCFVDEIEVELDQIFQKMALPMQQLFFID